MWIRLVSVGVWFFLVASSLLLFPVAALIWAVTSLFDPHLRILHRFTCFWGSLYTWFSPAWRVKVEGRDRIRRDATYVMVANHQSLLDIIVLFRIFAHFKWVSKIENFRIPLIGWNMRLNRYIELRRGDRQSIKRMLEECLKTLADGNSIMMFPEGTRSPDGHLRRFKEGAFQLAKDARCPILPIVIEGTATALPKKGLVLRGRHRIRLRVLDEIPYESFADQSVEALTGRVHDQFARELPEPYKPHPRGGEPDTRRAGGA